MRCSDMENMNASGDDEYVEEEQISGHVLTYLEEFRLFVSVAPLFQIAHQRRVLLTSTASFTHRHKARRALQRPRFLG